MRDTVFDIHMLVTAATIAFWIFVVISLCD